MPSETRTCETCKQPFVHEEADLQMYKALNAPPAVQCPHCRLRDLFAFWNFGAFRKTVSALSGKGLITVLPASVPYPIYARDEWVSDAWDSLAYGRDYDPARPFFEQFQELYDAVPRPHQSGVNNTDSEWADDIWNSKNCYLCRSLLDCEQLSYVYRVVKSKDSIDLVYSSETERSYDCLYCWRCYETRHAFDCRDCIKSAFLYDCRNVQNCFMCWNLRNKQYCILNQQYSKEEYEAKLKEYDLRSHAAVEKIKKEFAALIAREAVHRENFNTQVSNCEGNFLTECRNCKDCTFLEKSENCRHSWRGFQNRDCIDMAGNFDTERSVRVTMNWKVYECLSVNYSSNCRYSAYLDACEDCEYCFGCVGLRKKKYCVFNKQYDEQGYAALTAQIKAAMEMQGEWGRFFPISMAKIGYNITNAQLLFPETEESAKSFGATWHDFSDETPTGVSASELPDRINDVEDAITQQPLICVTSGRRYNIAPHELAFYRQYGIPLPRQHFDQRISQSFRRLAAAVKPVGDKCCFCAKPIQNFFPPEFGYRKVACVECYQREIA